VSRASLWDELRERLQPAALRIAARPWPAELLAALAAPAPEEDGAGERAATDDDALFAQLGTGLWRLRDKLIDPVTREPRPEARRAYRHLESVWDLLRDAGLEILDHRGERFDTGLSMVVLAYQPTPGTDSEYVLETVKPTIYRADRRIQVGEVIVATTP
jgi:hypothetical protein